MNGARYVLNIAPTRKQKQAPERDQGQEQLPASSTWARAIQGKFDKKASANAVSSNGDAHEFDINAGEAEEMKVELEPHKSVQHSARW